MDEKSAKSAKESAMLAAIPARDRARDMALSLGGARKWGDTKERFRERIAWKLNHLSPIEFTLRRVRAILSNEKIKLDADEYFAIEAAWARANEALASLSHMASEAAVYVDPAPRGGRQEGEGESRSADGEACRAAGATLAARGR